MFRNVPSGSRLSFDLYLMQSCFEGSLVTTRICCGLGLSRGRRFTNHIPGCAYRAYVLFDLAYAGAFDLCFNLENIFIRQT